MSVKCNRCYGRGWYDECQNPEEENPYNHDYRERYCDCPAGEWRRKLDQPTIAAVEGK